MPCALSAALRLDIIQQATQGATLLDIAARNHISYCSVRRIYKRFRQHGPPGLTPHYNHCGRSTAKYKVVHRAALWLKRLHPAWGAAFIIMALKERYGPAALPGERTLQRWFKAHGLIRVKPSLLHPEALWAHQVHDIWQIDAKEKLHLASGQKACYLSVVDEKSGCLLKAFVFPPVVYQPGSAQPHTAQHD